MKRTLSAVIAAFALIHLGAIAQNESTSLIAPGVELVKVRGDFSFIEGPVADEAGNLYFTDIPNNRIHKLDTEGKLTIVREQSNGANGLIFDADGNLLACEGRGKRVTSMAPDGTITVLAQDYNDKEFNSPNDLWIDDKGGIYFTDPNYGEPDNLTQDGEHVYYLWPDGKSVNRVVSDMGKPNGIVGTADNKLLYIADTGLRKVFVFNINNDATLGPKREFIDSGSDGMTLDEQGNLYITWIGGVGIYNPEGERLHFIETAEMPTNVGFAGEDHQTLYITARTSLYALQMAVKGLQN
ncbi:MAG: SMP-30/gluconolactonase/LRE family protein [Cellvibrionaceae bacterium]